MQFDQGLIYSSADLGKILEDFVPIKDNKSKLALEAYPSLKDLAAFAKLAYGDCLGDLDLPGGWKLLTTAQNNSRANGYFGSAFWSPTEQQVVVAHRGSENLGSFLTDDNGVYLNKYTGHMSSAVSFTDDIKKAIQETNERYGSRFVLSITGHSLGAWLASVTTMTVKYLKREDKGFRRIVPPDEGIHSHTVAWDSPGVKDMLNKIRNDYDLRYDRSMRTKHMDITNFFAAANPVNTTRKHVGSLYQLHISRDSNKSALKLNLDTHSLENFIKAFEEEPKIYAVQDWPQGVAECKTQCDLESHYKSHILRPDAEKEVKTVLSWEQIFLDIENTESVEGTAGSTTDRQKSKLDLKQQGNKHYESKLSTENTCHLGVFSAEELTFVQNWSLFQSNALFQLAEIDKFVLRKNLPKIDLPKFQMNTRRTNIFCETKEQLETLIRLTKQLMRWFPEEIMEALAKQNESIKSAPLYLAGQAYLRTLPHILDCEDTVGLELFLKSSQRVLQIQSCDGKFETARVYNILAHIGNLALDEIYLNQNCKTVLGWNDKSDTAKFVHFEGLNKTDITNNNLLIINFESTSNNLSSKDLDIFKIILNNLLLFSHKKLVIIRSHPVHTNIFLEFNLTVETKYLNKFGLIDLTPSSRTEIFSRNSIIMGEETLSLGILLGDDCNSNDEHVKNKINYIISPILKKLSADHQFQEKIQNSLPKICESDAFHSKVNTQVSKAQLTSLLERSGADGPLLVISDPEQLSQDYWGEAAEAERGRIFTSRIDGRELFLKKCQEEPVKLIYWLQLSAEGLTLSEVYNSAIYLPRMFHSCIIIKSVDELVRYKGSQDLFIFENADDKRAFINPFNLSTEDEDLFVSSEHFITLELSTENQINDESLNKHYFHQLEIGGTPRLVWQYSHGSLDGLRPFITRDYSNPIPEGDFCLEDDPLLMKKRVTIIAGDPGVGKTTSLTRLSELIQDSWVLRIDNKHSAIEELPHILDLQSVVKCLIHSSGLSTNDGLARNLLRHCLESKSSIQIWVLVDAFDEITEKENKKKLIDLLMYLKNSTTCNTIVSTRVYAQKELENYLVEFSAEIKNITEKEQDDYLVNSWLPHLALELPEHGEPEKRLRQFARELREEMEGVLGEDVAGFMGIPLQIRMLSEVFLRNAIKSVQSPNEKNDQVKIKNLFDLYTRFINVKNTIFFEQKTMIKKLPPTIRDNVCRDIKENHYFLAFQTLNAGFAKIYFKNPMISNEVMEDLSRLGLIQANTDGTFKFIHLTFVEYFCADFCVQWLRREAQTEESNQLARNDIIQKTPGVYRTLQERFADYYVQWLRRRENAVLIEIFRELLLWPSYKIMRKFIEDQLEISPIQGSALEKVLIIYRDWYESPMKMLHQHDKTPLHIAAEEQNRHTLALLLGDSDNRTTQKAYIYFISAKDSAGKSALNIALENGFLDIVKEITKNIESCPYVFLLEIMLSAFLGQRDDRDDVLFRLYCSNTQRLTNTSKALRRTDEIRKQVTSFIAAVRDDDYWTVRKILNGMKCFVERKYLVTAKDAQGDSLFLLSKIKPDWKWKYLLVKQQVSLTDSASRLIPYPPRTAEVRSVTNYARYNIFRWQDIYRSDEFAQTTLDMLHVFMENIYTFLIFCIFLIIWKLEIFDISPSYGIILIAYVILSIVLINKDNVPNPLDVVPAWRWKHIFLFFVCAILMGFLLMFHIYLCRWFLNLLERAHKYGFEW